MGKATENALFSHPPSMGADMDQPNFGNQWIYNLLHMDLASILSKELTVRKAIKPPSYFNLNQEVSIQYIK